MKDASSKLIKISIIVISFIILIGVLVIIFISPIAKYLIEKYDMKYTGRQVKIGWMYVNPFTGYIHVSDLKIYESNVPNSLSKADSIFFSARSLNINIGILKLLRKNIELSELTLDEPRGTILQNKKVFNIDDLINKFTPEKNDTLPSLVHINILGVKIINGEFYYHEKEIPVSYFLKEVNIESTGKSWDSDSVEAKFSFKSGTGSGSVKGNFTINFSNLKYRVAAVVEKFDLKFIEQYLKELANYGNFSASIDADMKATGNFNDQEDLHATGRMVLNDFHFGKSINDDYASFDKLLVKIDALSPKNHIYQFDSLSLLHPYFKYEQYDYLDNLETMFGKGGANIAAANSNRAKFNLILEIADYIKKLSKNFFESDYKIKSLSIQKGCIKFNDYSLCEKFSIEANPLFIVADSINKNKKRVVVSFSTGIQPYGNGSVFLSINPKDSGDFDMQYNFQKIPASLFNPYLITYTSFPLDRGTMEISGAWHVRNSIINSNNHLLIIDPRVTGRLINNNNKWIPLPLLMFFIRERGNLIDYQVPITGNLKNPKFHLKDVIWDIIGNIFVKPVTTPYRMEVKNIENEIEKSLAFKWKMRQSSVLPHQEKFINKMVDFLEKNPNESISVYPNQFAEKEKEYILFFEAKKKYFLLTRNIKNQVLDGQDSLKVEEMSVKDSLFVNYLNKLVGNSLMFTIQDKCTGYIGQPLIDLRFQQLNKLRADDFMSFFKKKSIVNRVKIYQSENIVPYNGFSFYKIVYKGEFPEPLIKAYKQMSDLNNEAPRKWFKKEREKIKNVF